MEFVARLRSKEADRAMLLFQLRRIQSTGTFVDAPKSGSDMEVRGEVPEDRVDALITLLGTMHGALHVGDRHVTLGAGTDHATVQEAEADLGGPYTDLARDRAAWSFGGDADDHLVQDLFFEGEADVKTLHERTGLRVEVVITALRRLTADGVVRKYRRPVETGGHQETYDLAGSVRSTLERAGTGPAA